MKLSAEKCLFVQKCVHFFGHVISDPGVETDSDKKEKLKNHPVPKDADELCSFIAFALYNKRYALDFPSLRNHLQICYRSIEKSKRTQKETNWTGTEREDYAKKFCNFSLIWFSTTFWNFT